MCLKTSLRIWHKRKQSSVFLFGTVMSSAHVYISFCPLPTLKISWYIFLKVISSDTDVSESESDQSCGCSSCSDGEDPEPWHYEDDLLQDISGDEPLPDPTHQQSLIQSLVTILQWFTFFFTILASYLQNK